MSLEQQQNEYGALSEDQKARIDAELQPQKPQPIQVDPVKPAKQEEEKVDQGEETQLASSDYSGFIYGGTSPELWSDVGNTARMVSERMAAPGMGMLDFGVDAINQIGPFSSKIGKVSDFDDELAQSVRDISSVVIPTYLLTRLGLKGGRVLGSKGPSILRDPVVQSLGETGVAAGSGALVDYLNVTSQEDLNLMGQVRQMLPEKFKFLAPDWIATLPSDSPDVKRNKTIMEGAGLGIFTDVIGGAIRLARALNGMTQSTKWVTKDGKSKKFFKDLQVTDELTGIAKEDLASAKGGAEIQRVLDNVEEWVEESASRRVQALDELGVVNASEAKQLDQPIKGVHGNDFFDPLEQGVRGPDKMGVVQATVDAANIQKNQNTWWGRLASFVTPASLKFGIQADNLTKRTLIKGIKQVIKDSGKYDFWADGARTTFKEIDEAGTFLSEIMLDPTMDVGSLKELLSDMKDTIRGFENLNDVAYNGAVKAIKGYMEEYMEMDGLKAQAYILHSLGGEASDLAQAGRLMDDTAAVESVREQLLDRMEYLMAEKGLAAYLKGSALNYLNTWRRLWHFAKKTDPKKVEEMANAAREQTEDAMANIIPRTKAFRAELEAVAKERPELYKGLALAWEFSDGNIDSIYKMNQFVRNSLGVGRKAFVDKNPNTPSLIVNGAWGVYFNSILSGLKTVGKAGTGNAVMALTKPAEHLAGATLLPPGMRRDEMMKAWYMYSGFKDALTNSFGHMAMVFKKASQDPTQIPYVMREDYKIRETEKLEVLKEIAKGYSSDNDGAIVLLDIAQKLQDLNAHPVLRLGTNGLSAMDGFSRALMNQAVSRGEAYTKLSREGRLNSEEFKKLSKELYEQKKDSQGYFMDAQVDYATREMTMNLDHPVADALSSFLRLVPAFKPFMMFPRTSMNMLGAAWNRTPAGKLAGDWHEMGQRREYATEEIQAIFEKRGIPIDNMIQERFATLQAETMGKVAIGTMGVMGGFMMLMDDRLRGDGHYDKEVQRTRMDGDWKPRTYKGWDGKWYSYENLGPIADLIALVANVGDNFDQLTTTWHEEFAQKIGFVIGSSITGKSPLGGLEPMFDILHGNPAAGMKWAATSISGLAPMSGLRGDLSRLLAPQMRELEVELFDYIRNRNNWIDLVDPNGRLPNKYHWIDGTVINGDMSMWARVINAFSPITVHDDMSDEAKFLMDIEYDSRPTFIKNEHGIEYTAQERSELYSIMGQQGYFKQLLTPIMKSAEAREFVKTMREARRKGTDSKSVPLEKFQLLFDRIDDALRSAKGRAEASMPNAEELQLRGQQLQENLANVEDGILPRENI